MSSILNSVLDAAFRLPGFDGRAEQWTRPAHDDKWELYDLSKDFAQGHRVAQDNPAKLKEMQDLFMSEAEKFQVFPLDHTYLERLPPANRPQHNVGRTS